MQTTTSPPHKKATNITLSADVLADAKAFGINISQACDGFLRERVKQERERHWLSHNAEFIAEYNKTLETEGLPLDQYRSF
jgi:antitoxin CcdA